ncbi:uncharacterized protein LOC100167003 [Acyrthosiphon pisum]|uniref:Uncharacterized protein n=1 Tax=Acyrthosiphon pisum TaxID=7029 RepID=A0A8R1W304_ACYPI|nr:uncharacterized protein LOC100167003 [Acyrthosiphon pisum]|eukprot:XP_001947472.2 PREDICTED: uncharacterized protein LOC100167003 [Acyrthosiphon pisum]
MLKENVADHTCNKLNNFRSKDEFFDNSHSSENLNSTDKFNLSNTHEKNNFETSIMSTSTDVTSHKKITGTNIEHSSSQLNKAQCKFLIDKIHSNESILNSQDEKLLCEIVDKMKGNIFSSNTDLLDLNTQQFMDLHLKGAFQRLNALSPTSDLDSSKTPTIKKINSDNSTVISPQPLIDELRNSEIKNNNPIIVNDPDISEKINYPSPKIDLELSVRDHYVEYPGKDQDMEIIAFRAMCEALLKIGAVDNNIKDNNKTIVKKNNQLNKHVKHNVIRGSNSTEYDHSTSKLDSFKGVNDISKRLARKRHQINDLRFDSSDDSSPEYSNELSSKQYNSKRKISKISFSKNNLKINSKCYSDTNTIQPKNVKKIKLCDSIFEDKEVDCMLIENKLPKVQNVINNLKCKNINDDSLEQTKQLKENQTIFYFQTNGKVHKDMLNSINKKN